MRLIEVLSILKNWQMLEIEEDNYDDEEKKTLYKGKVGDYDPKLSEVKDKIVEMVYFGYYDTVSIRLKR